MSYSVNEIVEIFGNLHVSKKKEGYTCGLAPHKPILLLSLLILEKNERIDLNAISVDMYLRETWNELWNCLKYQHPGPIYLPFYYMTSDGFWHIEFKEGVFDGPFKSLKDITESVYRVRLDQSDSSMFQDPSVWEGLINTL